jgi:hypothetical protein
MIKSREMRLMKLGIIVSEQEALKHLTVENNAAGLISYGIGSEVIKTI